MTSCRGNDLMVGRKQLGPRENNFMRGRMAQRVSRLGVIECEKCESRLYARKMTLCEKNDFVRERV
eukprot:3449956-Rhodomonas_salina.1